jgi:hypothetical protein
MAPHQLEYKRSISFMAKFRATDVWVPLFNIISEMISKKKEE